MNGVSGGSASALRQAGARIGCSLKKENNQKYVVYFIFFLLLLVTLLTHMGANSPYTYVWSVVYSKDAAINIEGQYFNPDAGSPYVTTTGFFYEPTRPDLGSDPTITLPLYSFCTSVLVGLTRSYVLSSYIVNMLFLLLLFWAFIQFARKFDVSYYAIGFAGVGILTLPFFAHYIGQPMHYIVGTSINFLVVLAVLGLARNGYKSAVVFGLLTGLLTLSYDWYVFALALVVYFVFFYRFKRAYNYIYYFACAAAPLVAWRLFMHLASPSGVNTAYNDLMSAVVRGWSNYFRHLGSDFFRPFINSQIGLEVSFKQILAYIYWPLLLLVICLLVWLKPRIWKSDLGKIAALLVGVYVVEQMVVAAYDWENNTRRAVPVMLAFAFAFVFVVWKTIDHDKLKYVLYALLVLSAALTFSDAYAKYPLIQSLQYGETIRGNPKVVVGYPGKKLDRARTPTLPRDEGLQFYKVPRARTRAKHLGAFMFAQVFLLAAMLFLLYYLYKSGLAPVYLAWLFAAAFFSSMIVRFV